MENLKIALYGTAAVVGFGLLSWGGIYVNGFFNAEREAQRTKVFQGSQAYNDGMKLQLNNLYLDYQTADSAGRIGIANATRDIFASVDTNDYPQHLQEFLREVKAR
jgi:hypothetical protein